MESSASDLRRLTPSRSGRKGTRSRVPIRRRAERRYRSAEGWGDNHDPSHDRNRTEAEGHAFTLFGGEPLLLPVEDLEHLWAWGLAKFGSNSVQTNGTLIDDEHVRLFKTYRVSVGISIDGPGALNDVRWHGSLAKTRRGGRKQPSDLGCGRALATDPSRQSSRLRVSVRCRRNRSHLFRCVSIDAPNDE